MKKAATAYQEVLERTLFFFSLMFQPAVAVSGLKASWPTHLLAPELRKSGSAPLKRRTKPWQRRTTRATSFISKTYWLPQHWYHCQKSRTTGKISSPVQHVVASQTHSSSNYWQNTLKCGENTKHTKERHYLRFWKLLTDDASTLWQEAEELSIKFSLITSHETLD